MYLSKYLDQPEAEKPKAPEEQSALAKVGDRLARGAVKYGVMPVAGMMQIAGDVTGIAPLSKLGKEGGEGAEMYLADQEKAHASQKFQDISSVGDAGKWAGEQLTEFLPQAALMAVTGGLGGAAGKLGAGALIDSGIATGAQIAGKSAVKAATANLGRNLTLEEAGTLAAGRMGTLGAQAANTAGSIGMETATIYQGQKEGQKDAGKAALYGVAAGILDSAVPNYLMSKTGVTKLLPGLGSTAKEAAELTGSKVMTLGQRAKDVAKIAGGAIPAEATQEGIQTVLERIGSDQQVQSDEARKNGFWNTVSARGIKAAVHPEAWDDIIESMAAGGLIGGVMGGGASGAGHVVDALAQRHSSALNADIAGQQPVPDQSGLQNPAAPPVGQEAGAIATPPAVAPVAPVDDDIPAFGSGSPQVARDSASVIAGTTPAVTESAPVVPMSNGPLGGALAKGGIGQQQQQSVAVPEWQHHPVDDLLRNKLVQWSNENTGPEHEATNQAIADNWDDTAALWQLYGQDRNKAIVAHKINNPQAIAGSGVTDLLQSHGQPSVVPASAYTQFTTKPFANVPRQDLIAGPGAAALLGQAGKPAALPGASGKPASLDPMQQEGVGTTTLPAVQQQPALVASVQSKITSLIESIKQGKHTPKSAFQELYAMPEYKALSLNPEQQGDTAIGVDGDAEDHIYKQFEEAATAKPADIDQAAHTAASSPSNDLADPTEAQIEAGNYKKGHVKLHGLDISIENPAGSVRKGVDAGGKAWKTELAHHYGYIKGTIGKDKDHIDTFIGPQHESGKAFVVDQVDPATGKFDEHKVMLGFNSVDDARKGYLANYDKSGKQRIGAITETSVDDFKQWLKDGNTKREYASLQIKKNKSKFADQAQEEERIRLYRVIAFATKQMDSGKTADERRKGKKDYEQAQKDLKKLPPGMLTEKGALDVRGVVADSKLIKLWLENVTIALDGAKSVDEAYQEYEKYWNGKPKITREYFEKVFNEQKTTPAVSSAPEHAAVGVDERELNDIVEEFHNAQAEMQGDDEQVTHVFDPPARNEVVRLQDKAKVYHAEHGWMTPAQAKKKIAEWKQHAEAQGDTSANRDKVVLSLFDLSGAWSQPWVDAGYQVFRFDIQADTEVGNVHNFSTDFFGDWFGDFDGMDIHAILSACPCTDFAVSGARHFATKDKDGRTVASVKLVQQTLATIEYFKPAVWAIENPVGRIEKLGGLPPWRLSFDPNHVGETYTKKTLLWGRFNGDLPIAPVDPVEGSKMHSQYGGKSLSTKNARSKTPEGFAYAFFMANNAVDHPAMAIANKYDRLDRGLIEKAVAAGIDAKQIDDLVEDYYYQELDDQSAEQAIKDKINELQQGGEQAGGQFVPAESAAPQPLRKARQKHLAQLKQQMQAAKEPKARKALQDRIAKMQEILQQNKPESAIVNQGGTDNVQRNQVDAGTTEVQAGDGAEAARRNLHDAASYARRSSSAIRETERQEAPDPGQVELKSDQKKLYAAIKSVEAEALQQYMQEQGEFPSAGFVTAWKQQGKMGETEHKVALAPDKITFRKFGNAAVNHTWSDYLNRLLAHNQIFTKTPYTFKGLSEINGELHAVIDQPYIHGKHIIKAPVEEIDRAMTGLGFKPFVRPQFAGKPTEVTPMARMWVHPESKLAVWDVRSVNVLYDTATKTPYFIDPMIEQLADSYDLSSLTPLDIRADGAVYGSKFQMVSGEVAPKEEAVIAATRNPAKHRAFLKRMLNNAKTDKGRENAHKALDRVEARSKPIPVTIDDEINSLSLDDMAAMFAEVVTESTQPAAVRNRAKMKETRRKHLVKQIAKAHEPKEQQRLRDALEKLQGELTRLESDQQAKPNGKPEKDNSEQPYFNRGDRIQFVNGVHGVISDVNTYVVSKGKIDISYGGVGVVDKTVEHSHSYEVKKDNNVKVHGYFSEIFNETDPAPAVVPAPVWGRIAVDPDDLLNRIESGKKRSESSRAVAGRAKKKESIKKHNSDADVEFKTAFDMQEAFDTWAEQYPEEAAKYAPVVKPAASPDPAAAGTGIEGLKVTFNAVQNGIELRFGIKPDDATLAKIKANGFRWAMGKKIWYAKDTPARRTFVEGLQGKQAAPAELTGNQKLTIRDLGPVGTKVQFKEGFNKQIYTISDIEPEVGKVAVDGEKIYRYASDFKLAEEVKDEKLVEQFKIGDYVQAVKDKDLFKNGPYRINHIDSNGNIKLEGKGNAHWLKEDFEKSGATRRPKGPEIYDIVSVEYADDAVSKPAERSASDILKSAASSGVKGADEALKGLYELFGGKSLKSFPGAVDEDTYRAAKPHFTAALENFRAAGKSLKEFFAFLIDQFGGGIQPYVMKYLQEKQQESGIIVVTNQEAANNDNTTDGSTGQGSLESNLPGTIPDPAGKREAGEGSGSVSRTDDEGNGNTDEGGNVGSGSMAVQPESVHNQPGEGSEGSAVLPSGATTGVTTPSEPRTPQLSGDHPGNYRITAVDDLGGGTRGQKIDANMAAIRLVKMLDKEGRYPTRAEQAVLVKYVGWGGLKSVFDPNSTKPQDQKARTELEQLLTDVEYFEARQSVLNAHYTSPEIIGSIYKVLQHMGFKGGNVLEPTYGSGNFIGLMPEGMAAASKWYGSELDPVTSKIGKFLYPDAQLLESGFQDAEFPYGKFDLAIGNPPFGAEQITDTNKKRAEIDRFKIHNYVIAKSGMHLRPGGVMAMVVTSRFMDTANPEARDYLAKQFKFLTAIRLPNDAFAKNAGTEVTTDLVFFQKLMPGETVEDQYKGWMETDSQMTSESGEEITLNKWFAKRPELMLGIPSMKGTMYGGQWRKDDGKGEFTLNARTGQDTAAEIEKLLQDDDLFGKVKDLFRPTPAKADAAAVSIQMNREDIGIGGYVEENGEIFMREDDDQYGNPVFIKLTADTPWTEKQNLGETRLNRIKGMLDMRQAAYDLIEAERFDLSDMEAKRKELNKLYDAFVSKHGYLSDSANASLMADDVKIESGLEVNYRKAITAAKAKTLGVKPQPAKADKAAIMQQRVFFPTKEITSAANARDGYGISLSEKGRLDLGYIAGLTGHTTDEVVKELAGEGLIYKDPATGTWKQEDEYLSGNVKAKLAKVLGREGFEKNVEALTAVLPKDVVAEEIFADLGATWIPAEVYKEFADLLGVTHANVVVIPETGTVKIISGGHVQNDMNVMLQNPDHDVASLINHIAAKQAVVAYDTIDDKRVVNKERTKALAPMVKRVSATFRDWLMADPRRATELTKLYNDTMNTHAPRTYNGKHLKTVGASPAVRLRNSQRNAAWRMLQSPVVLLDHVVGAGKTFTIITGVMERKRLGLSNKSMIVVPNHLVGQWGADFLKLYPGARILATTEKDFAKANRKRLFARIATGNYDAVIVGHSSFGFVPLESETQQEFVMEEISYLERALVMAEASKDKRLIRNITEKIAKKRERIKSLMNKERDDVVTFENMGIDNLVVDESHEFKNLEYSTSMQNITGMGNPNGAKKSFDMYAKIQYLRGKDGAITFATGTPISNSLVEMYTILRYLNRQGLKDRHLDVFDAWAKAYASIESRIEYTASQKLKDRQVMATFNNLPELLQLYSEFADVIGMKDLKRIYAEQIKESNQATGATEREEFPIPKVKSGARYLDVADPTSSQRQYMDYLVARANRLERLGGQNDPKTDNHLWLMNDARKMALDIRLVDPSAPSDPDNKVNRAANNIRRIYDQWHADKGAQLVFCDLSTPAGSSRSEAAKFIKAGMAALGLDKDKALANTLKDLSYSEQWTYLKNRIERRIEALSESVTVTDADEDLREKLEKYLDEVDDNDIAALQTLDTGFSVYDDLKATLIDMGIPASEIRFIHEANTRDQKTELFSMVNSGLVRVLIGSSRKMGAGTNAQERLVALHHMDAPWRPSDVEQREGRIIRQGNVLYDRDPENFEVEIPAYSTRNTFDSVSWQILARKAEMLEDFRSGARSMQDSDSDAASYAEFMAESTGNPAFREKFKLEREIEELESTERNINARRAAGERITRNADKDIAAVEKELQNARRDLDEIGPGAKFEVDGKSYADDLTEAYSKAINDYNAAQLEYKEKLLPEYVEARAQIEHQELSDKEQKEALKQIKKPVEPAKPNLARLEKTSQAARAAFRVSELLDDVADRGEVEFVFGGAQVVIEKVPMSNLPGQDATFDFRVYINGNRSSGFESTNYLKHVSQQKLMELFNTGAITSRLATAVQNAQYRVKSVKQSIQDAQRILDKLKFEDVDKLKAMQDRYKAVVEEVNQLEKDLDAKRENERNSYIESDRARFGVENIVPVGKKGQSSLTYFTGPGLNAADLQKEFAGQPFASHIKVVQSAGELPGGGSASRSGVRVEGQYKNGTIYLVADNLATVERAKVVALAHEMTHAGQSALVTDMAVDWFKAIQQKSAGSRNEFQQLALQTLQDEAAKRGYDLKTADGFRKAVQEATAVIGEAAYKTGEKNGLFTRLFMHLKHFMRKLGVTLQYSDKELTSVVVEMMRQGRVNLTNGRGPDGGQFALGKNESVNNAGVVVSFNNSLESLRDGSIAQHYIFSLGRPSQILSSTGVPDLPIKMRQDVVKKVTGLDGKGRHNLPIELLYNLPRHINNPVAIFASDTQVDSKTLLLQFRHNNKPVMAALQLEVRQGNLEVNSIASVYERNEGEYVNWVHKGRLESLDKLKGQWLLKRLRAAIAPEMSGSLTPNKILYHVSEPVKSGVREDIDGKNVQYSIASPADTARDRQLVNHLQKQSLGAKAGSMVSSLFDLVESLIPPKLKANLGKILSNPWFGSEGSIVRRVIVGLNLQRSHVRNELIHNLMKANPNAGYAGTEGLDNILKDATKEELKAWNNLIKQGDVEGEQYADKELKGMGYSDKVIAAYQAFHAIVGETNRVRFEKLKEISLLPYKNESWFDELKGLLSYREQLDRGLEDEKQIKILTDLLKSMKKLSRTELESIKNPTGKHVPGVVIDAYLKFIDKLNKTSEPGLVRMAFRHITEYSGEIDQIRNEWGQVKGYAPRVRKDGDWHVSVYHISEDEDGTPTRTKVFMQPTITEFGAKDLQSKIKADLGKHLKDNYYEGEEYQVEYGRNTATPGELLADKGKELALEALVNNAFDKAGIFKTKDVDVAAMKRAVMEELSKEIMAQGFSRHGISREKHLVEGYRDDDYQSVLKEFVSGMSGWLSKMQYAVEVTREADTFSQSDPDDKVWIHSYYKDSMKNSTYLDEVAATARSVGAVWYLGFKVSSAVVNAFQNYTVGQAELARLMKQSGKKGEAVLLLLQAQKDILSNKNITAEEHQVLDQAIRQGTLHAQAIRSMTGLNEQGFGSKWKQFTEKAMTPFAWVEQHVNREPAMLAAYRVFKTTAGTTFDQTAFDKAEEFVNSTHYVMGNENLPELVRMLGPIGETAYLFQGYVHNYLLWLAKRGRNGEFEAIARSFGAIALLGGVFALPGADDMDKWIEKWFGVSYKMKFKKFIKQNVGKYGTPGELLEGFINHGLPSAMGVDLSRAIAVNIPFVSDTDKSFGERIGGVWGGLAKKPGMALSAAGSGDYLRAIENLMPEFVANPMRAARQYSRGATTLAGKPVFDESGHQVKYGVADVARKALGFNPASISERTELKGHERALHEFWNNRKNDVLAEVRKATTPLDLQKAGATALKFNAELRKSDAAGLVAIITPETLRKSRTYKPDKKKLVWERNQLAT